MDEKRRLRHSATMTHLLTLNVNDFTRYTWIALLEPNTLATSGSPSAAP
jgi:hypothetical protein